MEDYDSASDMEDGHPKLLEKVDNTGKYIPCPSRHKILRTLPDEIKSQLKGKVHLISHELAWTCLGNGRYDLLSDTLRWLEKKELWLFDTEYRVFIFWKMSQLSATYLVDGEKITSLRNNAGFIRHQRGHELCWAYSVCDLVSITRVLYGWDDEFKPLSPAYLFHHLRPEAHRLCIKCGQNEHCCYPYTNIRGLKFAKEHGIPREDPDEEIFDCLTISVAGGDKYRIREIFSYDTLQQALRRLKTHPVIATLYCFVGWDGPGIYRGPVDGAEFEGHHSVIMLYCTKMEEVTVVVCKSSNGEGVGNGGYIHVSVELMLIMAGGRRRAKLPNEHYIPKSPTYLLHEFYSVDMEKGPNPKVETTEELVKENEKFKVDFKPPAKSMICFDASLSR